jgi:hypothetical protein
MVYSGQFAGQQKFNSDRTKLNWMLGYGITKNDQPDNRRITFVLDAQEGEADSSNYFLRIQNVPNAYLAGRLWLNMTEKIYDAKLDLEHKFHLFGGENEWTAKAGFFYERKDREFKSRLLGVMPQRKTHQSISSALSKRSWTARTSISTLHARNMDSRIATTAVRKTTITHRIKNYIGAIWPFKYRAEKTLTYTAA